jgi:NTE family protein
LRGRRFHEKLEALLPVANFEGCRIPFAASVFDVVTRTTRILDRGALAPAIRASCTLPFLFQPTWHEGRALLDGGILDRPGLLAVAEGERVLYHHLASRSPWRRRGSPALQVPEREGMTSLVLADLPRVGPFRLEEGARALEAAYARARSALARPHAPTIHG